MAPVRTARRASGGGATGHQAGREQMDQRDAGAGQQQ
jgi:hypothetical protein